ncbi:hypothetical protein [Clostridium neonatale]|uniref:Uncharacterized protein n=1 Tax=Clostridium neonatale TaxID=137838 RepID=A0AAD2DFJ9_9CLOT|nr:hypothetical protein [Clostridium neonatale]MBP8312813.1 hypothetical protein [Clostridium neonatale]CAI3195237.1 hypothetical protein CNEO2_1300006 [Clostridium neonatale]CAI3214082.1 hypothetical protein CNEO2_960019 [Clostridium neonatale]CAI3216165.1 hypothetical protein CNEO2_960006 [Clostridium neonatale]CAI3216683.1 hypothetical protein CNEO2_1030006 [Clostridium neonatale]
MINVNRLIKLFNELNEEGKERMLIYARDINRIEMYRRKEYILDYTNSRYKN